MDRAAQGNHGRRAPAAWRSVLVFLIPLSIYWLTAAPAVFNLDSAELTTAVVCDGLVHATGYPLYLLLGRVWLLLPFDDPGYGMNLMSGFLAALTLLLLDRVLRHLEVGAAAALLALGLLAFGFWFWGMALIAEVYTLQTCLIAGLMLALLRWRTAVTAGASLTVGLLFGLGMANHVTMVLLAPAVLVFVGMSGRWRSPRLWLAGCGGVLIGLLCYVELVRRSLAAPAFNYLGAYTTSGTFEAVDLSSWSGLLWLLTGRAFGHLVRVGSTLDRETLDVLIETVHASSGAGLGPALIGVVVLMRRDLPTCLLLLLTYLVQAVFFISYGAPDKQTMMLGMWLPVATATGVGLQRMLDWLQTGRVPGASPRGRQTILVALTGGLVLLAVIDRWPRVDLSMDDSSRQYGLSLLQRAPPGAIAFGGWETASILHYQQYVEGRRPDLLVVNLFHTNAEARRAMVRAALGRRPVLVDRRLAVLGTVEYQRLGRWFLVTASEPELGEDHD